MSESEKKESRIDEFIKWLDEEGIMLCGCFGIQEKYCPHYREKYKDASGGFCLCPANSNGEDCQGCKEKTWNEELGLAIDQMHYQEFLDDETQEKSLVHKGKPLEAYFK